MYTGADAHIGRFKNPYPRLVRSFARLGTRPVRERSGSTKQVPSDDVDAFLLPYAPACTATAGTHRLAPFIHSKRSPRIGVAEAVGATAFPYPTVSESRTDGTFMPRPPSEPSCMYSSLPASSQTAHAWQADTLPAFC